MNFRLKSYLLFFHFKIDYFIFLFLLCYLWGNLVFRNFILDNRNRNFFLNFSSNLLLNNFIFNKLSFNNLTISHFFKARLVISLFLRINFELIDILFYFWAIFLFMVFIRNFYLFYRFRVLLICCLLLMEMMMLINLLTFLRLRHNLWIFLNILQPF